MKAVVDFEKLIANFFDRSTVYGDALFSWE